MKEDLKSFREFKGLGDILRDGVYNFEFLRR